MQLMSLNAVNELECSYCITYDHLVFIRTDGSQSCGLEMCVWQQKIWWNCQLGPHSDGQIQANSEKR